MAWFEINIVTLLIALVIGAFFIKGLVKSFSAEAIFNSVISTINNLLFCFSLFISVYITRKIFVEKGNGGVWEKIYNIIPINIQSDLSDAGILIYLIVTPVILIVLFALLVYIRSLIDYPVDKISYWISRVVSKANRVLRMFIGIVIEVPKALIVTMLLVLLINLSGIYYPANIFSADSGNSKLYSSIYRYTLSPLISSDFGQKIPTFLQNSMVQIYKEIGSSKVLEQSERIKTLGFLRFQYESRSNEQIDNMARKIVGTETDERKKAYILYKWIGNSINYDWDKYNNIINNRSDEDEFGAIVAFNTRKGVCEDYADLYVAMARAVGLKVRIIVGQGYSMDSWGGHAWNEVYISKESKWISLDATWAKSGNYFDNKDFNKTHIFEAVAGEW